jgi:chromosome segregation ATPase
MPSTLEDFVDNLEKSPSSVEMNRHFDVFVDAMRDVRQRLENLELAHIQNGAKLATVDTKTTDVDARLAGVERDRTALKQRQDTVESKPLVHDQRLDDLEARVRMTEGAIGALGGKIEPATKVEALPIAPAPTKTWFGAQSKDQVTPPPMGAPVPA